MGYSDYYEWNKGLLPLAAMYGHVECLEYLLDNGFAVCIDSTKRAFAAAAANGRLECLEILHRRGLKWDLNTYHCAIANGLTAYAEHMREHVEKTSIIRIPLTYEHQNDLPKKNQ